MANPRMGDHISLATNMLNRCSIIPQLYNNILPNNIPPHNVSKNKKIKIYIKQEIPSHKIHSTRQLRISRILFDTT